MRRVGIPRRLFLLTSPIEGLKVTAAIVQVCGCSQAKAILSLVSDSYHTWAFVFGKRAEMRVMRVGRREVNFEDHDFVVNAVCCRGVICGVPVI